MFRYYDWQDVQINWEALDMNWEEVGILINDVMPYVSPPMPGQKLRINLKKLNQLPEEKRRRIIRLAMKIDGKFYEEFKYINNKDIKITAKHIKTIVAKVTNNIKVNVQNIS